MHETDPKGTPEATGTPTAKANPNPTTNTNPANANPRANANPTTNSNPTASATESSPKKHVAILTIHSSGDGTQVSNSTIFTGHSWIVFQNLGNGKSTTYGTWGNNPRGLGNGLHENLEQGAQGKASASAELTQDQADKFFATVNQYRAMGPNGWQYGNPCSGFASDAFFSATNNQLNSRTGGIVSNPSKLMLSIKELNQGLKPSPVAAFVDRSVGNSVKSSAAAAVQTKPTNGNQGLQESKAFHAFSPFE
jgi:hypothetical protein